MRERGEEVEFDCDVSRNRRRNMKRKETLSISFCLTFIYRKFRDGKGTEKMH